MRSIGPVRTRCVGAVGGDEAPGELELAVEPGVQQRPAVDLDAGLQQPLGVRRWVAASA